MRRIGFVLLGCACFTLAWSVPAMALELASANWKLEGENQQQLAAMLDRKIETGWTSQSLQRKGLGFTLDFGRPVMLHRIMLKIGPNRMNFPRSLRLALGDSADKALAFIEYENAQKPVLDPNFRFNPVKGRYLRIEIGEEGAGFPWSVAELHVYGFDDASALTVSNAVVLTTNMPQFVQDAARDVAYYVGEISGQPAAVVRPEEAGNYRGLRFVADELVPATYKPDDFIRRDLEAVQVYRKGNEIHFGGQTDWAIAYGMFEFLDAQGVRWLYPANDGEGDYIARRGPLVLDKLPMSYAPQCVRRFWQGVTSMGVEGMRWFDHAHWNVPGFVPGHAYRNNGHHSFGQLMPETLYKDHPDWFPMLTDKKWEPVLAKKGYKLGQRIPYSAIGTIAFCTTSKEAREYIVQQAVQQAKKDANYHSLRIGEDDATQWCECPKCQAQDEKAPMIDHVFGRMKSKSERLFDLAGYVARRLKEEMPDRPIQVATMAYSQTTLPPVSIPKLPDNVTVDLVDNLSVYLPVKSEHNKNYVDLVERWHAKVNCLGIYTHHLLGTSSKVPFVGITTLCDWFRFWKANNVDCFMPEVNGDPDIWRCNPWMYYAHGRLIWHPDEPAGQIIDDFFKGYFRESWEPMRDYYMTLEQHVRDNNLLYAGGGGVHLLPTKEIFSGAMVAKLAGCLAKAKSSATDYRTRQRVDDVADGFQVVLKSLDMRLDAPRDKDGNELPR